MKSAKGLTVFYYHLALFAVLLYECAMFGRWVVRSAKSGLFVYHNGAAWLAGLGDSFAMCGGCLGLGLGGGSCKGCQKKSGGSDNFFHCFVYLTRA